MVWDLRQMSLMISLIDRETENLSSNTGQIQVASARKSERLKADIERRPDKLGLVKSQEIRS
jgi:hypothetical protein